MGAVSKNFAADARIIGGKLSLRQPRSCSNAFIHAEYLAPTNMKLINLIRLTSPFLAWSFSWQLQAAAVKDGLILCLDAAEQVREGGMSQSNSTWRNLADSPGHNVGNGTLHGLGASAAAGWAGAGSSDNPYALRLDGHRAYVTGPGNLEIPELTLEAWAEVEGVGGGARRGATLIGNDFGDGGISLLIQGADGSPLLVHGKTFTPVDAETTIGQWHQFVVTFKEGTACVYVDGVQRDTLGAPRELQKEHYPAWQLGVARHPENDFVEADGLIGNLAIVRVYNRALLPAEVAANFQADKSRFPISPATNAAETEVAVPVSLIPALPSSAPAPEAKWDYYYHPVRITGNGRTGWPYGMRWAFDGYPTNPKQPYVRNYWRMESPPTPQNPAYVVIDYHRPVTVTRFVHYFMMDPGPSGWKDVDIYTSTNRQDWTLRQSARDLAPAYPQCVAIGEPVSARFYKIVVNRLTDGAPALQTLEIETWYGARPANANSSAAAPSAPPRRQAALSSGAAKPCQELRVKGKGFDSQWQPLKDGIGISYKTAMLSSPLACTLKLFVGGKPVALTPVKLEGKPALLAKLPEATVVLEPGATADGRDLRLACRLAEVRETKPLQYLNVELRLAVAGARIMFRPHIDWYRVEKGPNVPETCNGHNSATRMLCIQTDQGCLSLVPSTDNMEWGFTKENEMTAAFRVPLADSDPFGDIFRPITVSPVEFDLILPATQGDWWEAYRHVVRDLFKFEQPRQWAMPITQMQMLASRSNMRSEMWSEKWQTIRSHPWFDFFYQFYGTAYTLPSLYSWYLVTDDSGAKDKAAKVLTWLLAMQQKGGPTAGAWFSQYCVEKDPPELVGRDQAWNRWVMPHSTGTAAKTLLWYWEASGKQDAQAFAAARRGADWLLTTQRPDGSWPYALDLSGKPITDLADAGQIWCAWTLWKMYQYTGEEKYKSAAARSAQSFQQTFMDVHRYMGYWEDVSGAEGKVQRSWEGYEPAIAELVFADMGEKDLALAAAKDAAVWSWTRVTSTRQYETCYGETTEQSLCGPSQAQSPMIGLGAERVYELTGDKLWNDFAGAIKAINFCADPDQAYGMVATGGWDDPLTGVVGPPYDNVRPWVTPNNSKGDEYGRQVWNEWCTDQFAWLALEWLVREANLRAPQYVQIDPNTYRGTVLGLPGRVKMPEERCDVAGIDHTDINWTGYCNDQKYILLVMNHKEKCRVMIRPHEAHLDILTQPPQILVGSGSNYKEVKPVRNGVQYLVTIPADGTAILIWDRIISG